MFRRERRALHAATHALAAALVCGSPANGRALLPLLPLLLAHAAALPETALPLLLHLFRGDRQLCAAAPWPLFALLVRLHQADGGLTALADGFHEVADAGVAPAADGAAAVATAPVSVAGWISPRMSAAVGAAPPPMATAVPSRTAAKAPTAARE